MDAKDYFYSEYSQRRKPSGRKDASKVSHLSVIIDMMIVKYILFLLLAALACSCRSGSLQALSTSKVDKENAVQFERARVALLDIWTYLIVMYDNGFPNTLDDSFYTNCEPRLLVYVSKPNRMPTRAEIAGGNMDFVYCGSALVFLSGKIQNANIIVMYTKIGVLPNNKMDVLFLDGNIITIDSAKLQYLAKTNGWGFGNHRQGERP